MARIKTFANAGSFLPSDLNAIQDDYEYAFSRYRRFATAGGGFVSADAAATYLLGVRDSASRATVGVNAFARQFAFRWEPGDLLVGVPNARATKMRLRAAIFTNAVTPDLEQICTFGLRPITGWGGTSGQGPFVSTVGAVVTGSSAAHMAPGASQQLVAVSADFAAPAAGWYALAVDLDRAIGLNATLDAIVDLDYRQV